MEDDPRSRWNLRLLGIEASGLPPIPRQLADYIAALTPEDLDRIRGDIRELERVGLFPQGAINIASWRVLQM